MQASLFISLFGLLQAVFVCLNHLLDHLAADGAGLASGDIAVIAVLEIYANLVCSFHFELLHCLACSRDNKMIAGIVRHSFYISFSVLGTVS